MSHVTARPAVIEIIERRAEPVDEDAPYDGVIVPNEVRINGQPLLCSAEHPVKVHEVSVAAREVVLVTLTLFARRVSIDIESD